MMRRFQLLGTAVLFAASVFLGAQVGEGQGDDPPFRGEPPEYKQGQYCSPAGIVNGSGKVLDKDHPCHCKRHDDDPQCDGEPKFEMPSACNQWCHEAHCSCPVSCTAHQP